MHKIPSICGANIIGLEVKHAVEATVLSGYPRVGDEHMGQLHTSVLVSTIIWQSRLAVPE
jgi:hypothetical protein